MNVSIERAVADGLSSAKNSSLKFLQETKDYVN